MQLRCSYVLQLRCRRVTATASVLQLQHCVLQLPNSALRLLQLRRASAGAAAVGLEQRLTPPLERDPPPERDIPLTHSSGRARLSEAEALLQSGCCGVV